LPEERMALLEDLFVKFTALMERANFKRLTRDEIIQALGQVAGELGLRTDIDLGIFERLEVFVRGDVMKERTRRKLSSLFRAEKYKVPSYQRMVLILKMRPSRRLPAEVSTDSVYLKVFKDIPKADRDMLL